MLHIKRFAAVLGLAGAMAALPLPAAPQKDSDDAGVREAIRFERDKQAAADRQARIEEAKARGVHSADRSMEEPRRKEQLKPAHHDDHRPQQQQRQ